MPVDPRVEIGLELALLGIAMWPPMRASLSLPYWRAHVRPAAAAAAMLLLVAVPAAVLAALSPAGLRILTAVVCGARLAAAWRARPSYGRERGLPPGRLTLLPPVAAVEDERFLARQAAAYGPVFKVGGLRRNVVCVVGLDRGAALLRRHEKELAVPAMPFSRAIPKGFLRFMDDADHTAYRRSLQRGLSSELIEGSLESLRRTITGTLAELARSCSGTRGRAVDPRPLLSRLTFACLIELVFGVAASDPEFTGLARLYRGIDHLSVSPVAVRRARRVVPRIAARVLERPTVRRCVLSDAAHADPTAAADPTLMGNLVFMVRVGSTDIAGLLAWVLSLLGDHPEWLERLRSGDEDAVGPEGLAGRIVSETLRLQQSEYVNRVALRPVEIDGFAVPPGWAVRLCVHESHRDPRSFVRPDEFDPDRWLAGGQQAARYAPFGMDRHSCIGEHVTRAIGCTFAAELARGYDLAVAGSRPAVMGRAHWQPGRRFRVRLAARA